MASQNAAPAPSPSAHVIGNMFVEQYYQVLHNSPEEVYKFYQDTSVLSWPDVDGVMTSVTTMRAIDEKVMSSDYKSSTVEIKTVDAQHSYKEGVIVLVTGLLFGDDNIAQKFTQSFFLAPQDQGGYFVLNDVFRYVSDDPTEEISHITSNEFEAIVQETTLPTSTESSAVSHAGAVSEATTTVPDEEHNDGGDANDSTENIVDTVEEVIDVPVPPTPSLPPPTLEIASNVSQEDMPKKSYASIVKVMKGSSVLPVPPPVANARVATVTSEKPLAPAVPAPSSETPVPDAYSAPESSDPPEEAAEGYSVYVRNLPWNTTPFQLEEEFKKFGIIKPGGVQVRNHKQHAYCFGFVEFESASSMQSAIEASPVMVAGRQAVVEEKRTTTRVVSGGIGGRGRFPMARGGYRNDAFRGRGGYGGQGYGRSEFRARSEFSARGGRGAGGRGSESYQRVSRPNPNPSAISTA